jgi:hypothetical protein
MRVRRLAAMRPLDPERLRGLLFHVDTAFHARVNFLLVAESLFFAAVSQVWSAQDNGIKFMLIAIAILLTLFLWYPMAMLERRSRALARALIRRDRTYEFYHRSVRAKPIVTRLLAHALPLLFIVGWIGVLIVLLNKPGC